MNPTKLMLIDVDAMFTSPVTLPFPYCNLLCCDRGEGNFRDTKGLCNRGAWCTHAWRSSEILSTYRNPKHFDTRTIYYAVPYTFQKLLHYGWSISLWSTRPRRQNYRIIKALKNQGVWDLAQQISGTENLLNTLSFSGDGEYSVETVKLNLFESVYGNLFKSDTKLFAVESDCLEAKVLKSYAGSGLSIRMSPGIWPEMLAMDPNSLEEISTDLSTDLFRKTS